MPVRRLTRGGGLESGGPDEPVSAARVEPPEAADSRDRQAGSAADAAIMEATEALVDKEPDGVPIASETQFEVAAEPVPMMPAEVLKGALQELLSSKGEKPREREPAAAPQVTVDALKQALVALLHEAGEPFPDKASAAGGGKKQESGEEKQAGQEAGPYSETKLQHAAAQVISQLHAAKQELAKELEANLKQLKSVLQETQRIAKDMEAVLKEAKAEPSEEELARGGSSGGGKKQEPWNPPGLKAKGKQKQDDEDQSSEEDESSKQQGQVPEWEPPQDAVQH